MALRLLSVCRRTARIMFKIFLWVPVVIVSVLLLWAYYVYVYVMNISGTFPKGPSGVSEVISAVLLFLAHVLLFLMLSSYVRTIFARHKSVPQQFALTAEQVNELEEMVDGQPLLRSLASGLPIRTQTKNHCVRYCESCLVIKPDRCHHCSMCNRCVLKMDHHCPWVNNCVGYSNYKFFVLFLMYTCLLCVYFCLSGFYDFIRAWNGTLSNSRANKFNVIFCFFAAAMFAFSTSCLFFFHIYLVMVNKTTIENMQAPIMRGRSERRLFHLGARRNLQRVFGKSCLLALLPVTTSMGDGASFPIRPSLDSEEMVSMSMERDHFTESTSEGGDRGGGGGGGGRDEEVTSGEETESEVELRNSSETQPLTGHKVTNI